MAQPVLSSFSGYIGENFATLTFNGPLDADNPPLLSAFIVDLNGTPQTLTMVSVDGAAGKVLVTMSSILTPGDIIDLSYQDPTGGNDLNAIQGTDGADSASFYQSTIVSMSRPGPSAPAALALSAGSDSGTPGDGVTSDTTPTVTGTAGANATVKLYDTDGTTLLGTTTADGSGNWSITSSALSSGSHSLKATQTDGGNVTSPLSSGLALTIDTAAFAPVALSLAGASDSGTIGDGITNDGTPTITGQAEANASVTLYDTDGTTVLGTTTANGAGSWSITSSALIEGNHSLTAIQTDAAGNVSPASAAFAYRLDTIGPVGTSLDRTTVPMTGATNGATVATLQATDASSITYGFRVGNGVIDADNGKFTISGNSLVAAQNLTAGTYNIYLSATDAAGNPAYQVLSFEVVNGPAISSIVRASAAAAAAPASAGSVSYTVTFTQDVTGVDIGDFVLTTTGTASGAIASISGSGSTYTVTVDSVSGDGTVRLDLNTNGTGIQNTNGDAITGGYTAGQTFTLDHSAPAAPAALTLNPLDDSGVSNSDAITSDTTPRVSGTGEALATINLYDTDGTTLLGTTVADGAGNWSITSSALATGSHVLTVRQVDAAGNVSPASTSLSVTIDGAAAAPAAPALAAASDTGAVGDRITSDTTPTVTGTAEAFASVTLYATDGVTALGTATANASGAWSIVSSTLGEGAHALTVKQTDLAGNVSAASAVLNLTVDSLAPGAGEPPLLAAPSDSGAVGDGVTNVAQPVITGTAEANSLVTLYDTNGSTVLGTATANNAGQWSITSSALTVGAHALSYKVTDTAGNVSAASAPLNLSIETPPAPPAPPVTLVDGVAIGSQVVVLPGGGMGTQVTVPVVTSGRVDSTGTTSAADIPLATSGAATLLLAQVGVGVGLSASGGASRPAGSSLEQLIQSIVAVTPDHAAADQAYLTGNGRSFLELLPTDLPLLVHTVAPVSTATAAASLTLTGTSTAAQRTALVIDAEGMAANSSISLQKVDFAAVIGQVGITGATAGQILAGDGAAQSFVVGAGQHSSVFAGGGNDTLQLTATAAGAQPAPADLSLLHGGQGGDAVVFTGALADYRIETLDAHLVVTALSGNQEQVWVVNAETLQFVDGNVAVQNRASLSTIAGLYADVLGRQADVAGIEFWAAAEKNGASLGQIAVEMIKTGEGTGQQTVFTGGAAHDIEVLYQAIFSRGVDSGGLAYWVDAMQKGMTLEQVADGMLVSAEIVGHQLMASQWDFFV